MKNERAEKLETIWNVGYLICVIGGLLTVAGAGVDVVFNIAGGKWFAIAGVVVLVVGFILTFIGDWDSPM